MPYGSDKKAYEKRIEDIIKALRRNSDCQYYMTAFLFFNDEGYTWFRVSSNAGI